MAGIYINIEAPRSPQIRTSSLSKAGIAYSNALCKEIGYYAPTHGQNETIEAIHIGGQPSYLSEDGIRAVVGVIIGSFDAINVQEFSIDVKPGAFDLANLKGLAALGLNVINITAGSFFEDDLQSLGLNHSPEDILATINHARQAGFSKIHLSLNINVPDQPHEYWAANLEKALGLEIQHVSLAGMPIYNLETSQDQLASCFSYPSAENNQSEKYAFASSYLSKAGLEHYVLSAFAKPGFQSKQRELQLFHGNILGIGPGAHSFWWFNGSHSMANRWSNVDNIEQYKALLNQKELPIDTRSVLDLDTLANEYTFLRMQHTNGLDLSKLEIEYGLDLLTERIEELAWLESEGYIEPIRNNRVRLSDYGKTYSADAFSRLRSRRVSVKHCVFLDCSFVAGLRNYSRP